MTDKTLHHVSMPGIDLLEVKKVDISSLYLSIYNMRSYQGNDRMDMVMLDKEEALELLSFLKENEQTILDMK